MFLTDRNGQFLPSTRNPDNTPINSVTTCWSTSQLHLTQQEELLEENVKKRYDKSHFCSFLPVSTLLAKYETAAFQRAFFLLFPQSIPSYRENTVNKIKIVFYSNRTLAAVKNRISVTVRFSAGVFILQITVLQPCPLKSLQHDFEMTSQVAKAEKASHKFLLSRHCNRSFFAITSFLCQCNTGSSLVFPACSKLSPSELSLPGSGVCR